MQARRIAEALCKNDGKAGGFVTLKEDTPIFGAPEAPTPRGVLTHYELQATCSGGPEGPLKPQPSSASVPNE